MVQYVGVAKQTVLLTLTCRMFELTQTAAAPSFSCTHLSGHFTDGAYAFMVQFLLQTYLSI